MDRIRCPPSLGAPHAEGAPPSTMRTFCKRSKLDCQALSAVHSGEGERVPSALLLLVELEQVPGVEIFVLALFFSKNFVVIQACRRTTTRADFNVRCIAEATLRARSGQEAKTMSNASRLAIAHSTIFQSGR